MSAITSAFLEPNQTASGYVCVGVCEPVYVIEKQKTGSPTLMWVFTEANSIADAAHTKCSQNVLIM